MRKWHISRDITEYLRFYQEIGVEYLHDVFPRPQDCLETISADIARCSACGLHRTRKKPVMGAGNPQADLMFVGEAPGHEEDRQGKPFVGAAGKLLTDIILAMQFSRETVYIANVLKCRPPQNRNPREDEMEACLPFLFRMVDCIKPKVICTLGAFPAQALLKTGSPISRLRGKFWEFNGIKVMPTYHPAYLLRNPDAKKAVWEDMQKVMELFGKKAGHTKKSHA